MEMEMEMVENQLQNSLKINEEEEEDRISLLPDGLLVEFLSRLPETKEAIKTCVLSKRWEHVWTYVPNLVFRYTNKKHSLSPFFSFITKTLTQCSPQSKLNKFQLQTPYDIAFQAEVSAYVRYAMNRNVEVFTLILFSLQLGSDFMLDKLFFTATCFTRLRLSCCVLSPTSAITWNNLKSLSISSAKLDEDLIQNILSGSPVLETLRFEGCYGYKRIDITSKSVKRFVFCCHMSPEPTYDVDLIEINAPNILSLTIEDDLWLWNLLLRDVSSLVKAHLDYRVSTLFQTTLEEDEEMLKGFILSLHHVKKLKLGMSCSRVLSRLEAKGFVLPLNKEYLHVSSPLQGDDD